MNLSQRIFLITVLLFNFVVKAQETRGYRYEILLGHDNDFTVFGARTDWHYTYGIHAAFNWKPLNENFLSKVFPHKTAFSHGIGAHIQAYTPDYAKTYQIVRTRQPYAGWGYFDFATNYAFENAFVQFKLDLGILGPAVQAGEIQNFIHEYFSKDIFVDRWENQIPNTLGVNLRAEYTQDLVTKDWFNIYTLGRASAGTIFNFVEAGLNFRLGKFLPISQSVARQQSLFGKGETEFFLEAGINMHFSAYNATIEKADANGVKVVPNDLVNHSIFNGNIGLFFASKRYTLGMKWNYTEGEIEGNKPHRFIIVAGTYKFN
ncbi:MULTISPECIES: lipid A-modifier LpxR family protein [unclassified Leeuwenhoekiella]|uniref:lipid A-modifier LpxR family protein n=1 Tax=unclassified Leeuwenhoekiella TaxID=2615029 RepID=UPI000C46D723|nr:MULTISPECIES: lipid A-modifier LpxR family protein [unclassified Leeuwenhoekiella]MAW94541.1 hypothetical protein [Leeuwenhoekiella sp.]MBA81964.1 hypothetical protein [Leeuwenhoekiella sp.]|tara:strand:- start:10591 stop:11544 length:954 start_codon:yes stop_codon:yes gene_type:complete